MRKSVVRLRYAFIIALLPLALGAAPPMIIPAPPQIAAKAYVLMDPSSGKVLVERNAGSRLPPASLTKIMTSYVAAGALERGDIKLDDNANVSVKAWKMGGSRMFIKEGTQVPVRDLLRGVVIQSGNDASVALAEHIAGSEDAFVDVMNQQVALLGLKDTHFMDASGLPASNHYTTARDLASIAAALIENYPEHYKIYSEKEFTYNSVRQANRNMLVWQDPTVDGVKTGYTEEAGYCMVASAVRDGMRLISVVLGTAGPEVRAEESQKLLSYGFRYYETYRVYGPDAVLSDNRIWGGAENNVSIGVEKAIVLTIPRGKKEKLSSKIDIPTVIEAPIKRGDKLGELTISMEGKEVYKTPLVALGPVEEAGFLGGMADAMTLFYRQTFSIDTAH